MVACLAVVGLVMGQKAEPKNKLKVLEVDKIVAKTVVSERYNLMKGDEYRGHWITIGNTTSFTIYPAGTKRGPQADLAIGPTISMSVSHIEKNTLDSARESLRDIGVNLVDSDSDITMASLTMNTTQGGTKYDSSWHLTNDANAEITLLTKNYMTSVGGKWSSSPTDGTSLTLNDKTGRTRVALGRSKTVTYKTGVKHERPESSLVLFDEKGTILHRVP